MIKSGIKKRSISAKKLKYWNLNEEIVWSLYSRSTRQVARWTCSSVFMCMCAHGTGICAGTRWEQRKTPEALFSASVPKLRLSHWVRSSLFQLGWLASRPPESTCAHSSEVLTAFLPGCSEFELRSAGLYSPALLPTEPSLHPANISFLYNTNYLSQHKKLKAYSVMLMYLWVYIHSWKFSKYDFQKNTSSLVNFIKVFKYGAISILDTGTKVYDYLIAPSKSIYDKNWTF